MPDCGSSLWTTATSGCRAGWKGPAPDLHSVLGNPAAHPCPYTLGDMSQDVVNLLNHLGQAGAHIVGLSMGGMIAQTLAIEHPERCFRPDLRHVVERQSGSSARR